MSDPLARIPLSAIRVFEAAARQGSFTRAAEELGMSQAAVSWQVKALEQRLDRRLFVRQPREVTLTPAGERLARAAGEAMAALRAAVTDLSDTGDGVLSITTLQTLATQWLAGRLGAFQLAHPKIAVRLDTDNKVVDLVRQDFDVAIRGGRGGWPGLEAIPLFPAIQTVLCTPAAMARLGDPPRPERLLDVHRVGWDVEWNAWFRAAGVPMDGELGHAAPRIIADTQTLEVAAALANDGAAIGSPAMFGRDLAAGRLVQPFDVYIGDTRYWLVYPPDRRRVGKIAAFREWLLDQVAADPYVQQVLAAEPRAQPIR
ncbi:LysR substrate-binding domain-containing protein [Phenylobacterium sp. J426]|uniref:LysR substrate-binding domain-containing protein n=1 Tax=Phenylobacterium sp. J426 TaxID=2898439 RepID=UPI0021509638|nr:LysR substrate-binding domain-containing protein [Phenylobacterium sp. J426]MCR5876009.1 LysR substrate-binding domain-containing protein [Phenylobacterium sp. J426]